MNYYDVLGVEKNADSESIKKAYKKLAKKYHTINAHLERLINLVLQASKKVKNTTQLSSGTTSVSYAAVQYIIQNIPS